MFMEMGPPVLEMSQKLGLEPEALMSADVPARLAAGAQSRERRVAKATLFFMEGKEGTTLPAEGFLVIGATD
jgi:hypothetical protein